MKDTEDTDTIKNPDSPPIANKKLISLEELKKSVVDESEGEGEGENKWTLKRYPLGSELQCSDCQKSFTVDSDVHQYKSNVVCKDCLSFSKVMSANLGVVELVQEVVFNKPSFLMRILPFGGLIPRQVLNPEKYAQEMIEKKLEKTYFLQKLSMVKEQASNIVAIYENRVKELEREMALLENRLDRYKAKEEEIKLRALEEIKKGLTLDSRTIVDLKNAKERIEELEKKLIETNRNRNDWKDLYDGAEIRVSEQKGKVELKEMKLEQAINATAVQTDRLEKARADAENWEKQVKSLTNQLSDQYVKQQAELRQLEEKHKQSIVKLGVPVWFQRTSSFLGMESINQIWAKGLMGFKLVIILLIGSILLWLASYVVRILVAVVRNIKAIFAKKQDAATVLKEMLTGMKEAKDSMVKKPVESVKDLEVTSIVKPTPNVPAVEVVEAVKPVETSPSKEEGIEPTGTSNPEIPETDNS